MEVKSLDGLFGNTITIYMIKTLLEKKKYPNFSILSGRMGVGKSTAARLIANELSSSVQSFNAALGLDLKDLEQTVFKLKPTSPKVYIFEEVHALSKQDQTSLLDMLDQQPSTVYILFTTTEIGKMIAAIKSRATVWNFKSLNPVQLSQLLTQYESEVGITLSEDVKSTCIRLARGVPRDLIKIADLMIAGNFSSAQLDESSGIVADNILASLLLAIGTDSVGFYQVLQTIGNETDTLGTQLQDFTVRYLLESKLNSSAASTLSKDLRKQLDERFKTASGQLELQEIVTAISRLNNTNVLIDLCALSLKLERISLQNARGVQVDRARTQQREQAIMNTNTNSKDLADSRPIGKGMFRLKLEKEGDI